MNTWQKLRISFDRSFTKSVWKQAAWFALFFFIFLVIFSLLGMMPVLRDVDDGSSNTFERIFYLLSTKQNYNNLIKGSNLLRWGYYTFVMILGSIVFGGMVSIISNMLNRHVSTYIDGGVTYQLKDHVAIVGFDDIMPGLVKSILSYKGYDNCQVVILSDQSSQTVRKKVCSSLNKDQQKRCFVYYGKQNSKDDLKRLNIPQSRRVFIKGNAEDKNHDSVNVNTLQLMVDIIRENRDLTCQNDEKRPADDRRIPITVDFNDPSTYSVFQVTDMSDDWRAYISLTPYNFHEDWARQVFVDRNCNQSGMEWIKYPSLDGEGITAASDKHVHIVIVGMSQMGVTMGVQAAQLLHFPNALGHHENHGRITFVDADIKPKMQHFRHRFKHLFETEEADYMDLTQNPAQTETIPPTVFSGRDARLLDIRFSFVNAEAESEEFGQLIAKWAADERKCLQIIVATDDNKRNMGVSLYLPDNIYYRRTPVIVQQDTSGYLLNLLHRSDNGKYSNLFSFGTKEPTYDISERSLILAKCLNYLYTHVSLSDPEWSVDNMMRWDKTKMAEAWEEANLLWQELSIANQWSNIYCAYNIPVKLRSIGIDATKECRLLTEEEIGLLAKVEHNRWMTEKLLMGFRKPTPEEQRSIKEDESKNMKGNEPTKRDVFRQLKKRYVHGDICPYDDLYESEKDYDKVMVAHMPWILKMQDLVLQNYSIES